MYPYYIFFLCLLFSTNVLGSISELINTFFVLTLGPCDAHSLGALARFMLCETLSGETASDALRWTLQLSPPAAAAVQAVVGDVVAPVLRQRLLGELCGRQHELEGARVRVQWRAARVCCALQLGDDALELTLQLAR